MLSAIIQATWVEKMVKITGRRSLGGCTMSLVEGV